MRNWVNFHEGGGGGERSVFWWTGKKHFQYGIPRFGEKYGWETVSSTLDSANNF